MSTATTNSATRTTTTMNSTTTTKNSTATTTTESSKHHHFPVDLFIKMSLKLPTKSLIRFRAVSKSWKSWIDDPDFVSRHLNLNNCRDRRVLVVQSKSKIAHVYSETDLTSTAPIDILPLSPSPRCCCSCSVKGYINGVMLLVSRLPGDDFSISLINPSIRKYVEVSLPPKSHGLLTGVHNSEFFLGFDEVSGDYRVLVLTRNRNDKLVQVYSLKTGLWRRIEIEGHVPFCNGDQVFVNGIIHWFGLNDKDEFTVFTFNVRDEVFRKLECPYGIDYGASIFGYDDGRTIGVYNGTMIDGMTTSLWVMGEYGVAESWMKLCTFNHSSRALVYVTKDEKVLFSKDMELSSYDISTSVIKKDLKPSRGRYTNTYVESLVLLTDPDGKESKPLTF